MDFRGILFYLIAHNVIAKLPLVIHTSESRNLFSPFSAFSNVSNTKKKKKVKKNQLCSESFFSKVNIQQSCDVIAIWKREAYMILIKPGLNNAFAFPILIRIFLCMYTSCLYIYIYSLFMWSLIFQYLISVIECIWLTVLENGILYRSCLKLWHHLMCFAPLWRKYLSLVGSRRVWVDFFSRCLLIDFCLFDGLVNFMGMKAILCYLTVLL